MREDHEDNYLLSIYYVWDVQRVLSHLIFIPVLLIGYYDPLVSHEVAEIVKGNGIYRGHPVN